MTTIELDRIKDTLENIDLGDSFDEKESIHIFDIEAQAFLCGIKEGWHDCPMGAKEYLGQSYCPACKRPACATCKFLHELFPPS